tara:strand:+ start:566 stop:802 length:237 start_codon:yes stop_codon:yes gene_type:complete
MSVHQVEQYYVYVEFGAEENFELIWAALKSLMENHYEPHDYELNEAAITVDGFDTKEDALSFEEEIKNIITKVNVISA